MAIALEEPVHQKELAQLQSYERILSSAFLEVEFHAALKRSGVELESLARDVLASLAWILPSRRLSAEIERVLQAGFLRGADLWHVSCALYVAREPEELVFLTLDQQQRTVARALGFRTS